MLSDARFTMRKDRSLSVTRAAAKARSARSIGGAGGVRTRGNPAGGDDRSHGIMVNQGDRRRGCWRNVGIRAQVWKVNEIDGGLEQASADLRNRRSWCVVLEDASRAAASVSGLPQHRSERTDLPNTGDRFLPHGSVNRYLPRLRHRCGGRGGIYNGNRNGKENGLG